MPPSADFLVIGAGIAGASIGHWLAQHARVVILEREPHAGYHSTGRSAALFMESYGTQQVRALTRASRAFLRSPPAGFADSPILSARGALVVGTQDDEAALEAHWETLKAFSENGALLSATQTCELLPVLRTDRLLGGVYEPDAADIDVNTLHQAFLRSVRRQGGSIVTRAEVTGITRGGNRWEVLTPAGCFEAPVIVNAAGAWADRVGELAGTQRIGLQPRRRSAFVFAPPEGLDHRHWPATIGANEDWYIKPDAGQLLGSPANADPVEPHDVQPEELDIATAIDRIQTMTTLSINRPLRTWAGLRSFVADGDLVGGWDPAVAGFFWVAAQGGYGIQTSAAMGEACAALALGHRIPDHLAKFGLTEELLSPARFSQND